MTIYNFIVSPPQIYPYNKAFMPVLYGFFAFKWLIKSELNQNPLYRINVLMHTHSKPIRLQSELIKSVTKKAGLVLDPCAGSYSVLEACQRVKSNFIGCDIKG